LQALLDQLAGLAAQQPVLALYEDVHWIDPSTLELLGLAVERIRELPVLALITFRPEFQPPWTGQAHVTTLTMSRLGRRQGADLVTRVTGDKPLPAEIVEQIVARTDGVPLFVEELTKTVLESGLLTDVGDHYELSGPLPRLAIPTTLHDSLMARLDRLAPVKEVAQIGAVIGREFSHELLAAVASMSASQLGNALEQLVNSELVFRRGVPPEATYSFKHALVRDAAYGSLLKSRRRDIHARIASALEAQRGTGPEMDPLELARHHLLADSPERALQPLRRAAERAASVGATAEAVELYRKAIELLVHLPESSARQAIEAELLIGLGIQTQLSQGAGSAEPEAIFERALVLASGQESSPARFSAAWNLWRVHNVRAEFERARAAARELTLIGQETGKAEFVLQAHHANWVTLEYTGEIQAALDHVERARRDAADVPDGHGSRFGGHDAFVCGAGTAAHVHLLSGRLADAEREISACLSRAERLGDRLTIGNALDNAITYGLLCRDHDFLPPIVERLLELGEPEGLQDFVALGRFARGWATARGGAPSEGETDMRAAIDLAEAAGRMFHVPAWLAFLAEILADTGRLAEADELCSKALDRITCTSAGTIHESEVRRIRGGLAARCGRSAEAIEHLAKAITAAQHGGARLLELRAATSLARLWAEQGERRKAYDLLAPVYGWFTEGFGTADLKHAKALLDQLP
jgi:predicted ATPase